MEARWMRCRFHLHEVLCIVLIFHLQIDGCLSVNIEGLALLEFRSNVVLDPHGIFQNWSPLDNVPCKWLGVYCVDGKVDMLDLNGLSLEGVLTPELGKLSHLRALLLSNNNFSGIIPKELGKLNRLELLDLRANNLSGIIPAEIIHMSSLKHLLLYNNRLQSSVPAQLGKLDTIPQSLADHNISLSTYTEQSCINRKVGDCFLQNRQPERRQSDISIILLKRNLMKLLDMFVMSKYWESSKNGNEHAHSLKGFSKAYIMNEDKYPRNSTRRILLQGGRNLPSVIPIGSGPIEDTDDVVSSGSGSFLAAATSIGEKKLHLSIFSPSSTTWQDNSHPPTFPGMNGRSPGPWESESRTGKRNMTWIFIVVILVGVVLLTIASILLIGGSRKKKNTDLRKAGLSAKLQKALTKALTEGDRLIPFDSREDIYMLFPPMLPPPPAPPSPPSPPTLAPPPHPIVVALAPPPPPSDTLARFQPYFYICKPPSVPLARGPSPFSNMSGIPKLNREELELACEDFCNIVQSCPEYTVYKGTLCSGVEIAVLSTMTSSPKDWTKHMETEFRKKIDTLSRVNHKNFINLLGYCDEDQPFVRMMVFEYAPSGTLSEHIHDKGFEHLDWGARMRIIMGIAYCLQYMHHELSPPVVHPNLQSKSIFLTDDYAAKISEMDFWKCVVTSVKASGDDEMDGEDFHADPSSNVYDFGVLLLEIISGKETYSREGSIVDWAAEKLKDPCELHPLADPMLKAFKTDQLGAIFEVIKDCVYQEPKKRPTMKDVATKLRQALMISPDSATPKLSPLWWAELEVLSTEAS